MQLTPGDLPRIAARTLAHYDQRAQAYWEGTRDHDVSQNITALLHCPTRCDSTTGTSVRQHAACTPAPPTIYRRMQRFGIVPPNRRE